MLKFSHKYVPGRNSELPHLFRYLGFKKFNIKIGVFRKTAATLLNLKLLSPVFRDHNDL